MSQGARALRTLMMGLVLWVGLCLPSLALQQEEFPSACTNDTTIGQVSWSRTNRAYSSNNSYARVDIDGKTSRYLKCTGYGFSIPTGAVINGIFVKVERKASSAADGGSKDAAVRLVKAGAIQPTDRSLATSYTTAEVLQSYGGSADLWGNTWTPADINATNFGAAYAAIKANSAGGSHRIEVDYISITVDYTLDTTAPTVVSILRNVPNPTGASAVSWTVTFSEPVTGVDTGDFALVPSGVTGAGGISVAGSGAIWTVSANTGNGSGGLGLNLVDNDSILDASSNKLGGNGNNNGNKTGEIYNIDKLTPRVSTLNLAASSPTKAASVTWSVTFSESVTGVDTADFSLVANGVTGASITGVSGSGANYTVTASTGSGSGSLGLNLVDNDTIVDNNSNKLGGLGAGNGNFTGQVYTVDRTGPTVVSINRADPNPSTSNTVTWTVTFSESVTGVNAADFALAASGLSGAFITTVTGSGTTWSVDANTGIGAGTLGLNLVDDDSIADSLANLLGGTGAGNGNATGQVYTISETPPLAGYSMGETWNGTADEVADSQGAEPGTATNGAVTLAAGSCRYGVFKSSSGSGSGSHVLVPGFPDLAGDFSISAWIRTTNNSVSGQRIFVDDETNTGGYGLSLGDGGAGKLRFYARGSSPVFIETPNVIANNTWYFVAAVVDIANSVRRLYVFNASGTLVSSVSDASTFSGWGSDAGEASIGGETDVSGDGPNGFHFWGNIDELNIHDKVLTQAALSALLAQNQSCFSSSVDHYELSLPTSSLACLASTVTVTACADSSSPCTNKATNLNGQTASLATSGATLGSGTVTFDATGVATTTLSYPLAADGTAVSVTLSGEQTTALNARQCCPNGSGCSAANSCSTTFNTAGFLFSGAAGGASATLPTQTAGTSSSTYYLRAVKTGTTTQACESALSGAQSVNVGYQCNNPATCSGSNLMAVNGGSSTTIARNNNALSSASTAVAMTFDANGNAPFTFNYSDVGQVTLFASKSVGGSTLSGTSNAFVVKPFGFELSAIAQTASPNTANPAASSGAGSKFVKADEAFSVTVTARTASGAAAPNYGKETSPEGVKLTAALVLPSAGAIPALNNASAFGSFVNGVATGTTFSWSEVGIITLTPSVADADYLGTGNVTGSTSGDVGRFVPDHFDTVVTQGCSAGAFTYSGQPFTVQVKAMNGLATPAVTSNYSGLFARNVALSEANGLAGSLTGSALLSAAFSAGTASSSTPAFTFSNPATLPSSAKLRAIDTDGVSSLRTVVASSVEGLAAIRSGRIQLANANGSDLLPLTLTARVQNYTSTGGVAGWFTSTVDTSCSTLSASNFAFGFPASSSTYTNNLSACTTGVSTAGFSGTPPSYTVKLKTPGAGKRGWADLSLNLGASAAGTACTCTGLTAASSCTSASATTANKPWLQFNWTGSTGNPAARATFGVTTSGPTIHMRELY